MTMTMPVDGRTARRVANRARVVEAMLELIDETGADPSIDQLVERSGVSERSIFRYFDGVGDLRRAVLARNVERLEPLLEIDLPAGATLEERVGRLVEARVRLCQVMARAARLGRRNADVQPAVAAEVARFRRLLDEQVRAHLGAELRAMGPTASKDVAVVIDVLLSAESWDQLTLHHRRSPHAISRAWHAAVLALLVQGA